MAKPTINFVWIGPPRMNQGGQDVLGPETFNKNLNQFFPEQSDRSPLVFWCQEMYASQYQAYFAEKIINITIKTIEEHLKQDANPEPLTKKVSELYQQLIIDPEHNKIIDRVYMKDIFFNLILATRGGYVVDTNVSASTTMPICFEQHEKFMFPIVTDSARGFYVPEVFIQYSPEHDLSWGKQSLSAYLHCYEETVPQDNSDRHELVGEIAIAGLLHRQLSTLSKTEELIMDDPNYEMWICEPPQQNEVHITALNVVKEYYNSHRKNRDMQLTPYHLHAAYSNYSKLLFDLDHGIDANLAIDIQFKKDAYHKNETLLHSAVSNYNGQASATCIKLLLARGADPHQIRTIKKSAESDEYQESVLIASLEKYFQLKRRHQIIKILLENSDPPIDTNQMVNGESALSYATHHLYFDAVPLLLEHGANPNISRLDQKTTPLIDAIRLPCINTVRLLLTNSPIGADPNLAARDGSYSWHIKKTPLYFALRRESAPLVKLLFEHNANPLLLDQPAIREELSLNKSPPSECQRLFEEALLDWNARMKPQHSHSFKFFPEESDAANDNDKTDAPDSIIKIKPQIPPEL